ncbi:MAG TPA: carboxypeptidase regulatory-like domain-containing protein, partial [Mycobacteriales bacterium]
LVQADSASTDDLGPAVDTAVALGAKFVSNSYGIDNGFSLGFFYDHYYDHPGTAIVVSSGDSGNVISWPSTNPHVVAVGGTSLTRDSSARGWHETAWGTAAGGNGAGSGCAPFESKPDYQLTLDTHCDNRATADVSAVADPGTGLAVYDTFGQDGWLQVGGTSLAAPLVTAMYALAGAPEPGTYPVTYPYHDPGQASHLTDVTEGVNSDCGNGLCQAGIGWDGPTGLGSPNGVDALRSGPHGDITGTVTDDATGEPVAGVTVTASPGGYVATTDADGRYQVSGALLGTYQLTAHKYGYADATVSGVQVEENQTVTADITLTALPSAVLSGTVTDGSGHGWPLYTKITVDGYPGGPIYTDPATGHYQVTLVQADHYTVHATALDRGYEPAQVDVPFNSGDVTRDIKVAIDPQACIAAGYDWNGVTEAFTGWTGTTPKDGWTVSGTRVGWSFDNAGDRPPVPGGGDDMAIADSGAAGRHTRTDTTLTTPVVDLSGHDAPQLWFDTAYYALGDRQTGRVEVSVDGGWHWATVWQASDHNKLGHVQIDLPQAAGHAKVQARFDYTGRYAWYWALDNVFLGTHTCVPVNGGLVTGTVTNTSTGTGVPGATITGAGGTTRSLATPDDPEQPDGVYTLFAPNAGEQEFTASAPGYTDATATVTVASGGVVRHDWSLTPTGG